MNLVDHVVDDQPFTNNKIPCMYTRIQSTIVHRSVFCVFLVITREFHGLTMAGYLTYSRETKNCDDDYLMTLAKAGYALVKQVLGEQQPVCLNMTDIFSHKILFLLIRRPNNETCITKTKQHQIWRCQTTLVHHKDLLKILNSNVQKMQ